MARLAKELNIRRVLALTATATPPVAEDIARSFAIAEGDIVRTEFHRPNLTLKVFPCRNRDKSDRLTQRLSEVKGASIVYVTLQKTAEEVSAELQKRGFPAKAYHAGMKAEDRDAVQNWFMAEPDAVVVATIAFGMGIDKADIRAVYHYNLPKSPENYAQEIGRAGRDGKPAVCELLASSADRLVLENFIFGDTPSEVTVRDVVRHLLQGPTEFDVSLYDLAYRFDIRPLVLETLTTYLELRGLLQSTGPFYSKYDFLPLQPSAAILARFDKDRADFLRSIFRRAVRRKEWFGLDVQEAARVLKQPRERIVTALGFLEQKGDLKLKVSGARRGFRRKNLSTQDQDSLCRDLIKDFYQRETKDLNRLQKVLDYAEHQGCFTAYLLDYFGEATLASCDHCGPCLGQPNTLLPDEPEPELGPGEIELLMGLQQERHPALQSPRQIARFVCGITSPASTRAKLRQDPRFGRLADFPFRKVLQWLSPNDSES